MSVYFIQRGESGPIKIGYSVNPKARLAALKTGSDQPLRIIGVMDGSHGDERRLHLQYAASRLEGEWFSATDEIVAHARSCSQIESPAAVPKIIDLESAVQKRFGGDPVAFLKHLKAELPTSAFDKIVAFAAVKLGTDAMGSLLRAAE